MDQVMNKTRKKAWKDQPEPWGNPLQFSRERVVLGEELLSLQMSLHFVGL